MNDAFRSTLIAAVCLGFVSTAGLSSPALRAASVRPAKASARPPVPVVPMNTMAPVTQTFTVPSVIAVPSDPWAWTKVALNGNNAAYQKARGQIDTAASQGRPLPALLLKYRSAAMAVPGDPLALFRWAYAAYLCASQQPTAAGIKAAIGGLSDGRYSVQPVTAYDFNRVRFLIATLSDPNPALADLGRRLLDVNPDDEQVEYALAGILMDTYSPPKTIEALGLAEDLIRREAGRAEPYALVGEVYYYRWKAHGQTHDGLQAQNAYLKYVELAPKEDSFSARAAALADAIGNKLKAARPQ